MFEAITRATLGAATQGAQARLDDLLAEHTRLRALLELGDDPDVAESIRDKLAELDHQVGLLLARWQQAGGKVRLSSGIPVAARSSGERNSHDRAGAVVTRTRRKAVSPSTPSPVEATRSQVDRDWRQDFGQLMARLGPGTDLAGEIDIVIEAAVSCDQWSRWPRHVQRHLVGLLACRLRSLQDEQGVPEYELQDGFSALTRFSKRVKPGFVFGLSRSHRPQHGSSWDDDAVRHWDQLAALLPEDHELTEDQEDLLDRLTFLTAEIGAAPSDDAREVVRSQATRLLAETLEAGVDAREPALVAQAMVLQPLPNTRPFLRLRRALRDASTPAVDHDDGLDIEADWGWWMHTRGKRGLIVGGTPSEETRATLEHGFGMAGLRWTDVETARRLLASGSVELLFVFERRISDAVAFEVVPLAQARNMPIVHVDHGTSVAMVKSAIERFTEREGEATL